MSIYLLEVGTEELPYKFIPQAIEQLNCGFKNFLNDKLDCNTLKDIFPPKYTISRVKSTQQNDERFLQYIYPTRKLTMRKTQ